MSVVAHADDPLLFQSPDLLHAVQASTPMLIVHVTAGDGGHGTAYWQGRETGAQAGFASMAGVSSTWTTADLGVTGHPVTVYTLTGATNIRLAFLRLPDGALNGAGFGSGSLWQLRTGQVASLTTMDSTSTYTWPELVRVLTAVIAAAAPTSVLTQDFGITTSVLGSSPGDHSDHIIVSIATIAAARSAGIPLTSYIDYPNNAAAANVTGADLTAKQAAFTAYQAFDSFATGTNYPLWEATQYQRSVLGSALPGLILRVQDIAASASAATSVTLTPNAATQAGHGLILAGRIFASGSTPAYPSSVTDSAGNTWHVSASAARNPPTVSAHATNSNTAFIAWSLAAASITSLTLNLSGTGTVECNLSEWEGITGPPACDTASSGGGEIIAPALACGPGALAVGVAYPANGTSPLGTLPAGTLPLQIGADAVNWARYQVLPAAGTLAMDWGAATASVQAVAVFPGFYWPSAGTAGIV